MNTAVIVTESRHAAGEKISVPAFLSAFAPFMIGALAIIEMVAYWGFGAEAGWGGLVGSGCVAAVLTFLFRDRLKKKA